MRTSGILMHISSLPSKHGIGCMGSAAYEFVDFLRESKQHNWQVLPLNPTSYGDSPYQSFSVFAGNPYFIDLDLLRDHQLLTNQEIDACDFGSDPQHVNYEKLFYNRFPLLKKAFERFDTRDQAFQKFIKDDDFWLDDYALYTAVKISFNQRPWLEWNENIRLRNPQAVDMYKQVFRREICFQKFIQFLFFQQWNNLKQYANQNDIRLIGDMPIYVALDGADVWANSELFLLDDNSNPIQVAGCPPDGFSPTGQLWGNPLYDWEAMKADGYQWWIERVRAASTLYDSTRIDHFRGFDAYYAIPYGNQTAEIGEWQIGPGYELFATIEQALGKVDIIAEDLGFLTPSVHQLLDQCGYPGMKVLQFAFNPWDDNDYLLHNHIKHCVVYTGTHDNDTVLGWVGSTGSDEVQYAGNYLNEHNKWEYPWAFIRCVWSSVANLAIAPLQDFLCLGSEARMNTPSVLGGNWEWRVQPGVCNNALAQNIRALTETYRRA